MSWSAYRVCEGRLATGRPNIGRVSIQRGHRASFIHRVISDRVARVRKGIGFGPVGLLSVTGIGLCFCNTLEDGKRWYTPTTARCESSSAFPSSAIRAPVIIKEGDGEESKKSKSGGWDLKKYYSSDGADQGKSGTQAPPPQRRNVVKEKEKSDEKKTEKGLGFGLPTIEWSDIGDKITSLIIPDWVKMVPGLTKKLQNELSMAPGSLAEEIWQEANDPEINPEIVWDCSVRVSDDLCKEEKIFIERRKKHTTRALARYLNIPEATINPQDVPTIAMCGSGGGLRALVAGSASYLSVKEAGLFDCITYTAGVSGSCWLQALYYSSVTGQSHGKLIQHLKNRLGIHIAYPPAALALVNSAPTNKYLLSGVVEKLKGVPDADYGIVDIYGVLLAARLLVPKGELNVDTEDLKLTNQRQYLEDGLYPMPIYTAVRHEIPLVEQKEKSAKAAKEKAKKEAWFQWFEFTPYEFWCEEFECGIPTWAIGRKFDKGRSVWRENGLALPELRVPLLMGIWGSAFCATLSHYYREIRPIVKGLAGFAGIDQMIAERDDSLIKVHPIDPAEIPNFALGMKNQLPASCPESIFRDSHLQLMDAGMSNNLPIYPLLRPGRDVDILIAFDASADVKVDNWLSVADGYARQRGIKGWPIGAGWPTGDKSKDQIAQELEDAQVKTEEEAQQKVAAAAQKDASRTQKANKQSKDSDDLGYCNVWVGTTEERSSDKEPPKSKLIQEDWHLMQHPNAGLTVIYFPFLANDQVEGVDPKTSDFMSTWNFVYSPEDIDKVVSLARANFNEGKEQTRRAVRAVYERKKAKRLEIEKVAKDSKRSAQLRSNKLGKIGEGDHGDHFS